MVICFAPLRVALMLLGALTLVQGSKLRTWCGPSQFFEGMPPSLRSNLGIAGLDGSVYVFGGVDFHGDMLNDLHRFDVTAKSWTDLSDLDISTPKERSGHAFVALGGQLYLFGGVSLYEGFNDLYSFDHKSLIWTDLTGSAEGTFPSSRNDFGYTTIASKLYVSGGIDIYGNLMNDLHCFDAQAMEWTQLAGGSESNAPPAAWGMRLEAIGSTLYVYGGQDIGFYFGEDVYSFELSSTRAWYKFQDSSGTIPAARAQHGSAALNGKLYYFGGQTADGSDGGKLYEFNPSSNAWVDLTHENISFPPPRFHFGMTTVADVSYIFGGIHVDPSAGEVRTTRNDLYSLKLPVTSSEPVWNDLTGLAHGTGPLPTYRPMVVAAAGKIYVSFGREDSGSLLHDLHDFDASTLTWRNLNNIRSDSGQLVPILFNYGIVSIDERIFVFQSTQAESDPPGQLFELNTTTMTWTNRTARVTGNLPFPRSQYTVASTAGKAYTFGGKYEGEFVDYFHSLDISTYTWTNLTEIATGDGPPALCCFGFAGTSSQLYLFGGSDSSDQISNDLYRYDPSTLSWTDLSDKQRGSVPSARYFHALTSSDDVLYLFGGFAQGYLGDLFRCDPATLEWTDLTSQAFDVPSARYGHGLTAIPGKLYLFGGINETGTVDDMRSVVAPKSVRWPAEQESLGGFIDVYDWDTLLLQPESNLSLPITLCTSTFPCSVHIQGGGILQRKGDAFISCLETLGCNRIVLSDVSFKCDSHVSENPSLKVQGTSLSVLNSTFVGCTSHADGGIIQSYDMAVVLVDSSRFEGLHTSGHGGAVSAVGSAVDVTNSVFINCSSDGDGGAIWTSSFVCFGSEKENSDQTIVRIEHSKFLQCSSSGSGGGLKASAVKVKAEVVNCEFIKCSAGMSGGAVSLDSSASVMVNHTLFVSNVALGVGGGAFHAKDGNLDITNVSCSGNTASAGGGGVLFWEGDSKITLFRSDDSNTDSPALFSPVLNPAIEDYTMCKPGNTAVYGPCVATPFSSLRVTGIPTSAQPAFPGLEFSIDILKQDAYNQTILSDSLTPIFVQTAHSGEDITADPFVTVAGQTVVRMDAGKAAFAISLQPSYFADRIEMVRQPYIYFYGSDLQTFLPIKTQPFGVEVSRGTQVCPPGFILSLTSSASSVRSGTCKRCQSGTYSVTPLAGNTPNEPSCFQCPAGGTCQGGDNVTFKVGRWRIVSGSYRLVGCPVGYELVNSVRSVFQHDVQQCLMCRHDQYIIDSNNSTFTCQDCPVGASCNGSSLVGLVNGSVWEVDLARGQYVLTSCPAGYFPDALFQACLLCSPGYYCIGGKVDRIACPDGTFTPSGATASQLCQGAVFVSASIALPLTREQFLPKQQAFLESLAAAAGVSLDKVVLESINRRQAGSTVQVNTKIAAADQSQASAVSSKLNSEQINTQLVARGLPSGNLLSVQIRNSGSSSNYSQIESIIIGVAIGGLIFLLVLALAIYFGLKVYWAHAAHKAFLAAFSTASPGSPANDNNLPLSLKGEYLAEKILGKSVLGCVVQAKARSGNQSAAIKLVIPKGKDFEESELQQLKREQAVLELFTAKKSAHAVNLVGINSSESSPNVCWFIMELLEGENLDTIIRQSKTNNNIDDLDCIKLARNVLAALKVMHEEGFVHRNIRPPNIVRTLSPEAEGAGDVTTVNYVYKLVGFGSSFNMDEPASGDQAILSVQDSWFDQDSLPYMSPEMLENPAAAKHASDFWSLGVSLFEVATGKLPFEPVNKGRSDVFAMWKEAIIGDLDAEAPNVLDRLGEDRRSTFDHNLSKVIAKALEKNVSDRFATVDEMHDAIYQCLIEKGEATYSVFISYRALSEGPLARILFDELNHTVTPGGHRVTVYWDALRLVKGENWEEGFSTGLLNSRCVFTLLSYGSTAPMAALSEKNFSELLDQGWDERPVGRQRLLGIDGDWEDNVLKEFLIASTLLERSAEDQKPAEEKGKIQCIYPILVGRPHPPGHPNYPRMGDFFQIQGGGGQYPKKPSPATNRAVASFLREKAQLPPEVIEEAEKKGVHAILSGLTKLQGCQLWKHAPDLVEAELTKEQRALVGGGFVGPAVDLATDGIGLTGDQRAACMQGYDERQVRMLKAQVRAKLQDFHEVIDRAVGTQFVRAKSLRSLRAQSNKAPTTLPKPSAEEYSVQVDSLPEGQKPKVSANLVF